MRIAGWTSFTKSFKSKSDAKLWTDEVSPTHKSCVPETCRLKSIARKWIGELDIRFLTKQHFNHYRDDRLKVVKGGSVGSELALIKRVLDTAFKKWGYGIPYSPI